MRRARSRRPSPDVDGVRAPGAASAAAAPGLPPVASASRLRRRLPRRGRRETLVAYLFVSPWLVGMTAFYLGPTIASFIYSFTKYPIIAKPTWTGLSNYRDILQD